MKRDDAINYDPEMNWTERPVIGVLLLGAEKDSFGDAINECAFYWVGKHPVTGTIGIVPSDKQRLAGQMPEFIRSALR